MKAVNLTFLSPLIVGRRDLLEIYLSYKATKTQLGGNQHTVFNMVRSTGSFQKDFMIFLGAKLSVWPTIFIFLP